MKRVFITMYITFLVLGFLIFLIFNLLDFNNAYLGGLVSAAGGVAYFVGIYTFDKRSNNMSTIKYYGLALFAGLLITMSSLYEDPQPVHYLAMAYGGLNLFFWDYYRNKYSVFKERSPRLTIDKPLPAGKLFHHNKEVSVSELKEKPVVWFFYRGNWCPFCVAQIEEVVNSFEEIKKLGYAVAFVSNQPQERNESLEKKLGSEVLFLEDKKGVYANTLGLLEEEGLPIGLEVFGYESDVMYPAVLISGKKGKLLYYDLTENYRDRPLVSVILSELKSLV